MLEGDDAGLGPRAAVLQRHDLGLGAQGVADEDRLGHAHFVVAEIGDERAERGVADREPYQQGEGEGAVDDDPPELGLLGISLVEMERLRIVGQRRDQQIVGLGDGAVRLVPDAVAKRPLLVITAGHQAPSPFSIRASKAPSLTCAPSLAFSSATIPSNGATRLCSIFIASSVTSFWPLVTASPCFTASAMILPGIGETMLPSPTLAPPPPPWRGAAKRQVAP